MPAPDDATRAGILDTAKRYVHADRNSNYGEPEDNFEVIAEIWAAYLKRRFKIVIPIAAYDVANLMFGVKLGRLANYPLHHDSYVDMAGYAAAGGEVAGIARENGVEVTQVDMGSAIRFVSAPLRDMVDIFADTEAADLAGGSDGD